MSEYALWVIAAGALLYTGFVSGQHSERAWWRRNMPEDAKLRLGYLTRRRLDETEKERWG